MNRIASIVAGLSLAFVATSATIAGTINVPGDYALIQEAIDASVNGDVINIAAGTYNESDLNPDGKAITIQGTLNGDGTLATTIDAQQDARVFTINSGEGSGTVIQDLIITGGSANGFGGGITIRSSSSPIISGCTILNNSANRSGGGIYCHFNSHPTITDCTITDNTANGEGADGRGGGIYCIEANPTISSCAIFDNSANESGGGIYCNESNPTITDCTITDNTANGGSGFVNGGGGIACEYSDPTITDCTISDNEVNYAGGGIHCWDSNPTISGCTISGNWPFTVAGSCATSPTPPSAAARFLVTRLGMAAGSTPSSTVAPQSADLSSVKIHLIRSTDRTPTLNPVSDRTANHVTKTQMMTASSITWTSVPATMTMPMQTVMARPMVATPVLKIH